jgi:hypothetical protein
MLVAAKHAHPVCMMASLLRVVKSSSISPTAKAAAKTVNTKALKMPITM